MVALLRIAACLIEDVVRLAVLLFRSNSSIRAENLFLRRELALFIERGVRPRRIDAATRVSLAVLAKLFYWHNVLMVVQPGTLIRWHRAGWRLLWRIKSQPGRPPIPAELRALIRRMANENLVGQPASWLRTGACRLVSQDIVVLSDGFSAELSPAADSAVSQLKSPHPGRRSHDRSSAAAGPLAPTRRCASACRSTAAPRSSSTN